MDIYVKEIQRIDEQIKIWKKHRATLERDMSRIIEDRFSSRKEVSEFILSYCDEDTILYDEGMRGYYVSPFRFDTSGLTKQRIKSLYVYIESALPNTSINVKPGVIIGHDDSGFFVTSGLVSIYTTYDCLVRLVKKLYEIV